MISVFDSFAFSPEREAFFYFCIAAYLADGNAIDVSHSVCYGFIAKKMGRKSISGAFILHSEWI